MILITGAAKGIGRATAIRCAREGARIVVTDIDAEALASVKSDAGVSDAECVIVAGDISKDMLIDDLIDRALDKFGRLDGLVNNAGISGPIANFEETSEANFEQMVGINLRPVWRAIKCARVPLRESRHGSIVNVASIAALRSANRLALYGMTKGAVTNLTMTAALEFATDPVRVNAVCPGPIATNMIGSMERYIQHETGSDRARELIETTVPMRRYGFPDEVAAAICFLLSDEASFITGAALPVDGGSILKA